MSVEQSKYRNALPQLDGGVFITDGGLETVLVFQQQVELPMFAAFDLLSSPDGIHTLRNYYQPYIDLAVAEQVGLVLDTATWRASKGWGEQLGYSSEDIRQLNQLNVAILQELRSQHLTAASPMVINGVIGPQDDGYSPATLMDATEAQIYHRHQIEALAASPADMVSAITMTYADEAIGITRAARNAGIPVVISFTVETDGRLPDGMPLGDAIVAVDEATNSAPAYFMINCAHPSHFEQVLGGDNSWVDRIHGVRANASRKSHAELDEAVELDEGNPEELGLQFQRLRSVLPNLRIVGGCCGTDHRHVSQVCDAMH